MLLLVLKSTVTKPRQRAWRPAAARFAASRDAAAGVNGSDTVHRLGEPSGRTRRVGTVFGAGEHMALLPVRHMCMLMCRISVWDAVLCLQLACTYLHRSVQELHLCCGRQSCALFERTCSYGPRCSGSRGGASCVARGTVCVWGRGTYGTWNGHHSGPHVSRKLVAGLPEPHVTRMSRL